MQLYELEKRLTMDVKILAKEHDIDMSKVYVNVQTMRGAYGFYSPQRWMDKEDHVDELGLNPEHFSSPEQVIMTMLHELVHVYCKQNGIKDTSRHGYYHNKRFKDICESWGITCNAEQQGWATRPENNKELIEATNSRLPYKITGDMIRKADREPLKKPKVQAKKILYTCMECGQEVKSKDFLYITCMDCLQVMEPDEEHLEEWEIYESQYINKLEEEIRRKREDFTSHKNKGK